MRAGSIEWREVGKNKIPIVEVLPDNKNGIFVLARADDELSAAQAMTVAGMSPEDATLFAEGVLESMNKYLVPTDEGDSFTVADEARVSLRKRDGSAFSSRGGGIVEEYVRVSRREIKNQKGPGGRKN